MTNDRLPNRPVAPETPDRPFREQTESELEDMIDLFDYGTPLFGALLATGDDMPV